MADFTNEQMALIAAMVQAQVAAEKEKLTQENAAERERLARLAEDVRAGARWEPGTHKLGFPCQLNMLADCADEIYRPFRVEKDMIVLTAEREFVGDRGRAITMGPVLLYIPADQTCVWGSSRKATSGGGWLSASSGASSSKKEFPSQTWRQTEIGTLFELLSLLPDDNCRVWSICGETVDRETWIGDAHDTLSDWWSIIEEANGKKRPERRGVYARSR